MTNANNILNRARRAADQADQVHQKETDKKHLKVIGAIAISILLVIGLFFVPWDKLAGSGRATGMVVGCEERACFIHHGDNCIDATFTTQIAGITLEQRVQNIGQGECRLTRTAVAIDPEESDQVKALEGKRMECLYPQFNFNPLYADLLLGNPNECQGPLLEGFRKIIAKQ